MGGCGFRQHARRPSVSAGQRRTVGPISISSTDTLADVAGKINTANAGVSATVLTDSSGQRLLLRSSATGEESGFRIQVSDVDGDLTDGGGLSRLGFDPENNLNTTSLTQTAKDTEATLNGVPIRSANEQFVNLVDGVTLTVTQTTTAPVTVQVGKDPSAARTNINNFASSTLWPMR